MKFSKRNLLNILLMSLTFTAVTSCDKDDDDSSYPSDAVTLNMLDEQNGKTLLGTSDLYINKSNNFRTYSYLLSDVGKVSGVGAKMDPKTGNLVKEAAVIPGHMYQIFNPTVLRDFASGTKAVQVGAGYYQVYVASKITSDNVTTGAVVQYVLAYPDGNNLPKLNQNMGTFLTTEDRVEIPLPKGAEYFFEEHNSSGDVGAFEISNVNGKLVVALNNWPDKYRGPWGTYKTYIRLGNVFTIVVFNVGTEQ